MRPSRKASAGAWVAVAVVVAVTTAQAWPERRDREGFRSQVGVGSEERRAR